MQCPEKLGKYVLSGPHFVAGSGATQVHVQLAVWEAVSQQMAHMGRQCCFPDSTLPCEGRDDDRARVAAQTFLNERAQRLHVLITSGELGDIVKELLWRRFGVTSVEVHTPNRSRLHDGASYITVYAVERLL